MSSHRRPLAAVLNDSVAGRGGDNGRRDTRIMDQIASAGPLLGPRDQASSRLFRHPLSSGWSWHNAIIERIPGVPRIATSTVNPPDRVAERADTRPGRYYRGRAKPTEKVVDREG